MPKGLVRDGLLLMIAKFFSIGTGLITAVFVARYYGVDLYGEYTTAVAFSTFILTFTDLGLDTFLLKESSSDKSMLNKYYSNIMIIKLFVLTGSVLLIILLANILGYNHDIVKLIVILVPNTVIAYIISTFFVIMQIEDKLAINAKVQIFQSICIMIIAISVVVVKLNIFTYAILQSLISIFVLVIYIFIAPVKFTPTLNFTKFLIKGCIVFGISSLLYIVYYKVDTVMISFIKGPYEVGIYESAYKVINIIISMIAILDNLFMPKFFKLYKQNVKQMFSIFEGLLKYGIIFGIPFSIVGMFLSKYFILILYGKQYSDAINILEILIWSTSIRLLAAIVGFVITATNNMKIKIKFQGYFAIANIVLNSVLIPMLGVKGAAIATIITELMVLISYYIFVKRKFNVGIEMKYVVKAIIVNSLLIIILSIFKTEFFIPMILISIFASLIIILGAFYKDILQIYKVLKDAS